jgi:hypothetical protein
MFEIDKKRVQGDTGNMLLSNISEQLSEIIMLLKPHKEVEKAIEPAADKKLYTCKKCGKTSDSKGDLNTPQRLAVHSRFCKGV